MLQKFSSLQIGRYQLRHPIVQGAMAVQVSGAKLASAVANAGGLGVISTLGLGLGTLLSNAPGKRGNFFEINQAALVQELQKARAISPEGVLGVNILIATKNYETLVKIAAENGANVIITAAGLPLNLPELTADYPEIALVPMVCGLEAVQSICQAWQEKYQRLPDAFVVENSKSVGGHIGSTCDSWDTRIECLLPQIRQYLQQQWGAEIPLIATGGVWDGADVSRMLSLGASGVQVGSRFILTEECDADPRYKEFHLGSSAEDLVIVPSPVGKPARALKNAFSERAIASATEAEKRCVANCLESCLCRDRRITYCILQALDKAARGDVDNGLVFSSEQVGRATQILPVAEVMAELTTVSANVTV